MAPSACVTENFNLDVKSDFNVAVVEFEDAIVCRMRLQVLSRFRELGLNRFKQTAEVCLRLVSKGMCGAQVRHVRRRLRPAWFKVLLLLICLQHT